jgi:hypothetical protein
VWCGANTAVRSLHVLKRGVQRENVKQSAASNGRRVGLTLHVCAVLQLGHCPQEDYPEAIQDTLEAFLVGETDSWPMGKVVASRMNK